VILAVTEVMELRPWVLTALVVAVATGLAAASYQLLEMPIRRSPRLAPFGATTLLVGVACSALVAATVVPTLLERNRLPAVRASEAVVTGSKANSDMLVPRRIDWERYRDEKGAGTHLCLPEDMTSCVVHEGGTGLDVAVIGDSHGRQLSSAMIELAEDHDFTLSLNVSGGCPWQLDVTTPTKMEADTETCGQSRIDLYNSVLEDMGIDVVVLSQEAREVSRQIRAPDGSIVDVPKLNLRTMTDTVDRLRELGIKVVIVETFLNPGAFGFNPLECLSAARRVSDCRVPVPEDAPLSDSFYRVLAAKDADVADVNINGIMCPAWPVCDSMEGRIPVWRDTHHYSADALIKHKDEIWDRFLATGFFDEAS
jgi:hypothetical protein